MYTSPVVASNGVLYFNTFDAYSIDSKEKLFSIRCESGGQPFDYATASSITSDNKYILFLANHASGRLEPVLIDTESQRQVTLDAAYWYSSDDVAIVWD